ncbi:MAG: toll/interleukin-1 receptor domain-containing protein [Woeseiaceae bacterium]|nr:toll/interleukin-1 receptor domain-containing protein [Woeseiaceae bacterium]
MEYGPRFELDTFISYAQVAEKEWVRDFREKLQEHLDRELHQDKVASVFLDANELDRDSPLKASIAQTLSNTATLLIVLSKAYLEQPCRLQERESFFNQCDSKIRELAASVSERLNHFKQDRPEEIRPVGAARSRLAGANVFIADGDSGPPAKELEDARSTVRNWLKDLAAIMLPGENGSLYPAFYDNRAQCEATIDELLKDATIFVQLFGVIGDDDGYESWLCKRAKATSKDFLILNARLMHSTSNTRPLVLLELKSTPPQSTWI